MTSLVSQSEALRWGFALSQYLDFVVISSMLTCSCIQEAILQCETVLSAGAETIVSVNVFLLVHRTLTHLTKQVLDRITCFWLPNLMWYSRVKLLLHRITILRTISSCCPHQQSTTRSTMEITVNLKESFARLHWTNKPNSMVILAPSHLHTIF